MSAKPEQRLTNGRSSPKYCANNQSSSRFTAVNGLSPVQDRTTHGGPNQFVNLAGETSRVMAVEDLSTSTGADQNLSRGQTTPSHHRQDSHSSSGRKRSSSPEPSGLSSSSPQSRKKRRLSPLQNHQDTMTPVSNGDNHGQVQLYVEAQQTPMDGQQAQYADAQGWQDHQHGGSITSDAQLADALQRESQFISQNDDSAEASPVQGYRMNTPQQSQHSSGGGHVQMTPGMTATMLQKQRKRNFSNRTKTGCLTCRERKKKCDEAKPTCNNCERGGFFCKGYSSANGVFKASIPRDQPPLQAKNEYYDPASSSPYPPPQRPVQAGTYFALPPPDSRPADGGRPRPMSMDQERDESRFVSTPQDQNATSAYSRIDWQGSQQVQNLTEAVPRSEDPPPVEGPRQNKNLPHPGPPIPLHPPHHSNASQSSQYTDQRMTAQLALEHASSRLMPSLPAMYRPEQELRTEKDKMLSGASFNRLDPQLIKERNECAVALQRFHTGKKDEFRKILEPNGTIATNPAESRKISSPASSASGRSSNGSLNHVTDLSTQSGHLGTSVEVGVRFYCDYGYNIRIGDNVEIGRNCTIKDSATVRIGARTIISDNVTFTTQDAVFEGSLTQPGEVRLFRARPIVIGEDCYVGPGTVVKAGTVLENGSVVEAGDGTVVVAPAPAQRPNALLATVMNTLPSQHWPQSY